MVHVTDDPSEDDFTTFTMFLSPSPNESHGAARPCWSTRSRRDKWIAGPTTLRGLIEIYGSVRFEICLLASLFVCRGRKYQSARCIKFLNNTHGRRTKLYPPLQVMNSLPLCPLFLPGCPSPMASGKILAKSRLIV